MAVFVNSVQALHNGLILVDFLSDTTDVIFDIAGRVIEKLNRDKGATVMIEIIVKHPKMSGTQIIKFVNAVKRDLPVSEFQIPPRLQRGSFHASVVSSLPEHIVLK